MAKRRKTKRRTTRRRRGMGRVAGNATKRALCLLASIASANLVQEGMAFLSEREFMQAEQQVDSEGKPVSKPGINIKQAALSGGVMLGAGLGAVLIKNEYANAALLGVSTVASVQFKEDVVKPILGISGMGSMEDFLELYKNKRALEKDLGRAGENVQLAGDQAIELA